MKLYLCKRSHWRAVQETSLYYLSELRLARHRGARDFPVVGETVQFLADRLLGTAVIQEAHHNGYAGHFVLAEIESYVPTTEAKTEQGAPADTALVYELFLLEEEQQQVAATFAALESQKKNITRRLDGKAVQLTTKPVRKKRKTPVEKEGTVLE